MNAPSHSAATLVVCLIATTFFLHAGAAAPAHATEIEHDVKVEFIDRFTRFIEWPEASGQETRFVIGIVGEGPIAERLEPGLKDRLFDGRQPEIRRINDLQQVETCNLVYIAPSERGRIEEILSHTTGRPILTVADAPGLGRAGVIINLIREGEYLRFEVNRRAADASGLRMSSQLMRLAIVIEDD